MNTSCAKQNKDGKITLLWQEWSEERTMDGWGGSETYWLYSISWSGQLAYSPQKCWYVYTYTFYYIFCSNILYSLYKLNHTLIISRIVQIKGLQRCGKSCRLRWTNYLRPDIKRGRFSFEEEETIIQLHSVMGNK